MEFLCHYVVLIQVYMIGLSDHLDSHKQLNFSSIYVGHLEHLWQRYDKIKKVNIPHQNPHVFSSSTQRSAILEFPKYLS